MEMQFNALKGETTARASNFPELVLLLGVTKGKD